MRIGIAQAQQIFYLRLVTMDAIMNNAACINNDVTFSIAHLKTDLATNVLIPCPHYVVACKYLRFPIVSYNMPYSLSPL